jgi:glycerophosphoryl diester phosphodiesterase
VFPENTLPGFEYAIAAGAHGIELDVAVSRDLVPVISHDPHLASGAAIHSLNRDELPLPSLADVLALASRGEFVFNIELKSFPDDPGLAPSPAEFSRLVLEMVHERELQRRVWIASFDFRVLRAAKEIAPEIVTSALWEAGDRDWLAMAAEARADIVSPQYTLIRPELVRAAHAANLGVAAWTVNDPADWDRLIEAGVDTIITDDPARLRDHVAG